MRFKFILNQCNLFFAKKGTDIASIQKTQGRMKHQLAAVTISVLFQCEGFAIQSIDKQTGEDSSLRFDRNVKRTGSPWVRVPLSQERYQPKIGGVSDDIFKVLYGKYWKKVKQRLDPLVSGKERKEEAKTLRKNYSKFLRNHS